MKRLYLFLLTAVILAACSKTDQALDEAALVGDESQTVLEYIKGLGFDETQIQDIGDDYLVEGDILFAKNVMPNQRPKTKQYGTNNYVGYNVQPNVTVRIDPSLSAYTAEITAALAMWNSVINTRLKFSLTTSTNQHILITHLNLGIGGCGLSTIPMNGLPGNRVYINGNEMIGMSAAQRKGLVAHELGHAIGFRHTNWQADGEPKSGTDPVTGAKFHAAHILGTPLGSNPDPNSIMNSGSGAGSCNGVKTALSSYDIIAFQYMYPANPPVPGAIPVFRYNHEGYRDHFFTTDINEVGNGSNSTYIFEGIGFFAAPSSAPGSIPIYRYYHFGLNDHYYTRTPGSYSGYTAEGIAFYAFYPSSAGSVPIYRYNHNGVRDHHYTKNPNEGPMPGYTFERIEFYAY